MAGLLLQPSASPLQIGHCGSGWQGLNVATPWGMGLIHNTRCALPSRHPLRRDSKTLGRKSTHTESMANQHTHPQPYVRAFIRIVYLTREQALARLDGRSVAAPVAPQEALVG